MSLPCVENAPKQRWMVDWSSATASGNDRYEAPITWSRHQVITNWEAEHRGCYVDKLTSCGAAA